MIRMLDTSSPRCVLLVIHTGTFFVELIRLARLLSKEQVYRPVLVFYPLPTAQRDAAVAAGDGIESLDHFGRPLNFINQPCGRNQFRAIWGSLRRIVLKCAWKLNSLIRKFGIYEVVYQYVLLVCRRRCVDQLLRCHTPVAVVLGGDMVGYDTSVWVKVSHNRMIPVTIVSSTMSNGLEQAEIYYDNARHGMGLMINRYAASRYPNWVIKHKGRVLLREKGARVLVMEYLGLAPKKPWIFNSSEADAIAIESDAMKEYYMEAGLESHRLVITGSPSDDAMASILEANCDYREKLLLSLNLSLDKPILLTALPPDFLYVSGGRPQCDFSSYNDLVRFWIATIAESPGFNKIISLHPSVDPESMRFLESDDVRIATSPVAELIPLCDIYVASVSSTIRWAIACGKPVINYDVYRYRYNDYNGVAGVLATEEQQEFVTVVQAMTYNAKYRNLKLSEQVSVSRHWGRLDGKSGYRVLELIHKLVEQYEKKYSA